MTTPLCQPAVALRSRREDDGLGWGFFWFSMALIGFLIFFTFLVYKFWWLPRKQSEHSKQYQQNWKPSTLRWSDSQPATMQSTGLPPGYNVPKSSSFLVSRHQSQSQLYAPQTQGPPVIIIPPDMDLTKTPSPRSVVPFSPQGHYRVQQEHSPYPAGDRRMSYNPNISSDPTLPYEAVAVRTTTTTRRTTVLSPVSQSRVTTIV